MGLFFAKLCIDAADRYRVRPKRPARQIEEIQSKRVQKETRKKLEWKNSEPWKCENRIKLVNYTNLFWPSLSLAYFYQLLQLLKVRLEID